jgi:hypothetical protein
VKKCIAVAALALLVASSNASAAKFTGVTSQKDTRFALDVRGHRVVGAELHFTMDCDDGSSIARSAVVSGNARISPVRRFRLTDESGGMTVVMKGRLRTGGRAEGTFEASTPTCYTGTVGWVGAR